MTAVCSSIFDTVSVEVTLNVLFEYFSEASAVKTAFRRLRYCCVEVVRVVLSQVSYFSKAAHFLV